MRSITLYIFKTNDKDTNPEPPGLLTPQENG